MPYIKYIIFFWLIFFTSKLSAEDEVFEDVMKEPKYQFLEQVGHGAYGVVFKKDNHVIKVARFGDTLDDTKTVLEIALYKAFNHASIPKISGVSLYKGENNTFWEIKLPFYEKPDTNNLSQIIKDLASTLAYAHAHGVAHRDIKNAHILAYNNSNILIDWGAADIFCASPSQHMGTTVTYRDPAFLIDDLSYPKASDLWSLGISILELNNNNKNLFFGDNNYSIFKQIFSEPPIPVLNINELLNLWQNGVLKFETKLTSSLNNLKSDNIIIKDLFNVDPKTRISAQQLSAKLGNSTNDETLKFSPSSNILLSNKSTIDYKKRRKAYLWLQSINKAYNNPDKILFEAMSIADRFIEKSTQQLTDYFLPAAIAYYFASGFYDRILRISNLVNLANNKFTQKQFQSNMKKLLKEADYNLLFNHTLRDFQNDLYKDLPEEKSDKAIMMLKLLEIDENTFAFNNEKKWDLVSQVINNIKSNEAHDILENLCTSFKSSSSFENDMIFNDLCVQPIAH